MKGKTTGDSVRILHYIKHLESGGGEILLYNIYQNIDRSEIQFDFLVNTDKEEKLDEKIRKLGGRKISHIKNEPKFTPLKILIVIRGLKRLLSKGEYKILHIHCSNGQGLLYAYIAKMAGVPVRIVHIHNTTVEGRFVGLKRLFHNVCRKLFMNAATDYMACSNLAAEWLFSDDIVKHKKYFLLKNGIEVDKYKYNFQDAVELRSKFGWSDKKIILNIGRMEQEKNQVFLLKTFNRICDFSDDYRLIVIGKGSLENEIKTACSDLNLNDKVRLIDYTTEVEKYLSASDIFLLPSLSEGLGIVAIEAQASGLPTVISDTVPMEARVTDLVKVVPLNAAVDEWANAVMEVETKDRKSQIEEIKNAGYDIKNTAMELKNFYKVKLKELEA